MGSRPGLVSLATDPQLLSQMSGQGGSMRSRLVRSAFRIKHLALGRMEKALKANEKLSSK